VPVKIMQGTRFPSVQYNIIYNGTTWCNQFNIVMYISSSNSNIPVKHRP